jgi:hypothetical protein
MRIDGYGIGIDVPTGWEGRIYKRPDDPADPGTRFPVLQLANFPLPVEDGDFGSAAVSSMGAGGVFIVLMEFGPDYVALASFPVISLPLAPSASEFDPASLQVTIPGQAGIQRFLTVNGRAFCLYIVVGSLMNVGNLAQQVVQVLKSLSVEPAAISSPA